MCIKFPLNFVLYLYLYLIPQQTKIAFYNFQETGAVQQPVSKPVLW